MASKLIPQFSVYLDPDAIPSQQWVVIDSPTGLRFKGQGVIEAVDKWVDWLQLDVGIRSRTSNHDKGEL